MLCAGGSSNCAPWSGESGSCAWREKRRGFRPCLFCGRVVLSRRNKVTRRRADQLRSPLRAVPDLCAHVRVARLTTRLGIGISSLIGKNNVVLDGNVLHGIVRLRRRAEREACRFRV
jgi:hypothetical protein